ncbi:MAG: NAD-dependent protein deacylase [Anaerolineae bacterium]|nr:NAD-dependent protein deacylase [Anaerolineae bacterium]
MSQDIHHLRELLLAARYAIALTGAGISTPSGIPDFRSPGAGLWNRADPFATASIWAFRDSPETFYNWLRPLARAAAQAHPNAAHLALADLEQQGLLRAVITQNVDGLHQEAGSRRVLEVHGHTRTATCLNCLDSVPTESYWPRFLAEGALPRCRRCHEVLKPDVVLFGEPLPYEVMAAAQAETLLCDLMLVVGSSLDVMPVSDLPFLARRRGARLVVINYTETPADTVADLVLRANVAEVLPQLVAARVV